MKAYLRLKGKIHPRGKLSAVGYQRSEMSHQRLVVGNQHSILGRWLPAKSGLTPKTYYLMPENQLSASYSWFVKLWLMPKTYYLTPENQLSVFYSWFVKLWLMPKTYYLTPENQLSVISIQNSKLSNWLSTKFKLIPKTYYLIPFILLVFVSCSAALAQEFDVHVTPAAQAEATANNTIDTEITPLKIGDKIPDELWEMYFPVVSAKSDQVQYLSLGDFKDKLIILDFWATWCAPCISSLHKLDTLQGQFKEDLIVVPTSYEPRVKVETFLKNQGIDLPSLFDEKELRSYLPYKMIPHQVWIKNNVVRAIMQYEDATSENVKKMLAGEAFSLHTKKDVLDYSTSTPLATYADRIGMPILGSSAMTPYIDGIPSSTGIRKGEDIIRVNFTNVNSISMYNRILGGSKNNRIQLEDKVIEKYSPLYSDASQRERAFCYQRMVSGSATGDEIKRLVLEDLNAYFNLELDSQMVNIDCYVISKSEKGAEKHSPPNSLELENSKQKIQFSSFLDLLNFSVLWTPDQPIFVDESNFEGEIFVGLYTDLQKDIPMLQDHLSSYGLVVKKEKRPLNIYRLAEKKKDNK